MICHLLLNLRTKFCGVVEHTPIPTLDSLATIWVVLLILFPWLLQKDIWDFKELFTLAVTRKESFRPSSLTWQLILAIGWQTNKFNLYKTLQEPWSFHRLGNFLRFWATYIATVFVITQHLGNRVKPLCVNTFYKRPPPISNHSFKTLKFSQTTFCNKTLWPLF